jgi:flagellar biosynthesis GTPase FlhF
MDKKEIFAQYVDFIKLTYNEKQRMVAEYAQSQYGDDYSVMVAEMSDEYVVVDVFSWADWSECFKMFDYTIDEQGVSLANERACYRRFLSLEQIEKLDASVSFAKDEEEEKPVEPEEKEDKKEEEEFASQDDNKEEPEDEKDEEKEQPEDNKDEEEFVEDDKDDKDDEKESEDPEDDKKDDEDEDIYVEKEEDKEKEKDSTFTNLEGDNNEQKEDAELQETEESKENFTASAPELNNSEREELEAYRLKERLSLVNSYKDDLDADTISSSREMAQSVSYSELEAKLAIKYREVSKTNIKTEAAVFSFNNVIMNTNTPKSYAELVKATLNK